MIHRFIVSICVGILLGLWANRIISLDIFVIVAVSSALLILSIRFKRLITLFFIFMGIILGFVRAKPIIDGYANLAKSYNQKVEIFGYVEDDPTFHKSGQYEFHVDNLQLNNNTIDARLRIRSFNSTIKRGDYVAINGKLRDGFASWQGSIYYAETEVVTSGSNGLNKLRSEFIANIFSAIPDPQASLGLGFLIGVRSLLPDSLVEQLSITGLTHIVAVSGYNLTVLVNASRRIMHRVSRFQAVVLSATLLIIFVGITGQSPSILRASIVSGLSLGAWYYGRRIGPWLLLLYSSSISGFIKPVYVWHSVGWYLSLAAFFGVLIIAPAITKRFYGKRQPKVISQIVIETTSAQLMTMPIIMLIFGEVSVVALLANALVLPLIPLSMVLTFVAGISGFLSQGLAAYFIAPCRLLLQFITSLIDLISRLSWAMVEQSIGVWQMVFSYMIVMIIWFALRRKSTQDI